MINIDHVRVSFRNYRGSAESAQRVARLTMERLDQLSATDIGFRQTSRTLDHVVCAPTSISAEMAGEEAIAESVAARAWRTIMGHV